MQLEQPARCLRHLAYHDIDCINNLHVCISRGLGPFILTALLSILRRTMRHLRVLYELAERKWTYMIVRIFLMNLRILLKFLHVYVRVFIYWSNRSLFIERNEWIHIIPKLLSFITDLKHAVLNFT